MFHPSSRARRRSAFNSCVVLGLSLLLACDEDDACKKHQAKIESCDRAFDADICGNPEARCALACYAKADCEELTDVDEGRYPAWLDQCLAPCGEKFECKNGDTIPAWWRCDLSADCVDGSDERGCTYFECADGELLRETAACDGYPQCKDESDEASCP